jgi:hypothetical protein
MNDRQNVLAKVMKSEEVLIINDRNYYFYVRYLSKGSVITTLHHVTENIIYYDIIKNEILINYEYLGN